MERRSMLKGIGAAITATVATSTVVAGDDDDCPPGPQPNPECPLVEHPDK